SHLAASAGTPTLIYLKHDLRSRLGQSTYQHLVRWNPYPRTKFFCEVTELKRHLAAVNRNGADSSAY
ncbi:MAG TPA: hypothetical protein VFV81_10165, partial [Verrucomicrobiae bacterium]|nr:hypothetical protein [Verrucomicrobiae bacterium]